MLTLFYTSFTKWSALGEPEFNGLKNWRRMFTDESFLTATGNTLLYAAVHIPLTLALAFALAVLLNSKIKGRAFFRPSHSSPISRRLWRWLRYGA